MFYFGDNLLRNIVKRMNEFEINLNLPLNLLWIYLPNNKLDLIYNTIKL